MDTQTALQFYLLFVILPLWLAVGAADWMCHRVARIERTTGPKESALHLLMLAEAGLPVLMGLFLEINGLIILIMIVALGLHELTSYWDVAYAAQNRTVTPIEQRVHDYLGAVPFMAVSFVLVLHWPQGLALLGIGRQELRIALEWKHEPLPLSYSLGILAAITLFVLVPYAEELWRGLRTTRVKEEGR